MDGVKYAVQNGIDNLSGSSISSNAHPEDGYRFRARTAEELKQSKELVAPAGGAHMPKPPVLADTGEWVPPPDEIEAAAPIVHPGKIVLPPGVTYPVPTPAEGWIL